MMSISNCLIRRFLYIFLVRVISFLLFFIGHLLNGELLKESTRKAMDGVYKLIDLNKDNEDKNRGIPLEKYLNIL